MIGFLIGLRVVALSFLGALLGHFAKLTADRLFRSAAFVTARYEVRFEDGEIRHYPFLWMAKTVVGLRQSRKERLRKEVFHNSIACVLA